MTDSRPRRRPTRPRLVPGGNLPVEAFLDDFPPPMREIAVQLRAIVRRELPEAEERIRLGWRLLGYHLPVDDVDGVLEGRGITRQARWLTYRSIDEIDEALAVRLLHAAAGSASLPRGALR